MSYPKPIKKRAKLDALTGIKSSLNHLRSIIALLYLLYIVNGKKSSIAYCESIVDGQIRIKKTLLDAIESYLGSSNLEEIIKNNPLIKNQYEPLYVGITLLMKLANIKIKHNRATNVSERTGGNRYPKELFFTSNMITLDLILSGINESILKKSLIEWLSNEKSHDDIFESRVGQFITICTQNTLFKVRDENEKEIYFQTEGIFRSLVDGEENLTISDSKENVGPTRIYNSFVKEGISPWLKMQGQIISFTEFNDPSGLVYSEILSNTLDVYSVNDDSDRSGYDVNQVEEDILTQEHVLQKIYFGTPGSGKSHTIREQYEMSVVDGEYIEDEEKKKHVIRTTFHPDTDYASFVGCYKPISYEVNGEKKIKYDFVPQAFTEAYIKAWNDLDSQYYLVLEEINRGNCAQIFGDLFQLLDRKENGWSEYPINADADLKKYLEEAVDEYGEDILKNKDGIEDGKICLPPNLSIIASMNTSDQSLFPMDSAFKRRWSWEYVPIEYNNPKSAAFTITLGNKVYRWHDFLRAINARIKKVTSSEDKQMGNFFIKHSVDEKEFKDKVMFYLWSEVGKDNYNTNDAIFFSYKDGSQDKTEFSFNELYPYGTKKLQDFMSILGVPTIDELEDLEDDEEIVTDADGNTKRVKSYFSINGEGKIIPRRLMFEVVSLYVRQHLELTTTEIIETWNPIRTLNNVVISKEEYETKLASTTDAQFTRRYDALPISDGGTIYVFNNTVPKTTLDFINQVNSQEWGIYIEKVEE